MTAEITGEILGRFDRPGPRYTSYPTAVEFHGGYTEKDYRAALVEANALGDAPLSVYTHVPFCEERCHFCGCHVIATQHRGQTDLTNLALACLQCNRCKGPNIASVDPEINCIVPLFNPRTDSWSEHFRAEGGRIIPLTPVARATAALLNFDDPDREEARRKLAQAGRYP